MLRFPLLQWILLSSLSFISAEPVSRIVNASATPGGTVDASKALLEAWRVACNSTVPAIIVVPGGRFLLNPVTLNGPCKLLVTLRIDGTFVAPSSTKGLPAKWIKVMQVNGLRVSGGTLDGNGAALWACKGSGHSCSHGSDTLGIESSRDVEIVGLNLVNSKLFHVTVHKSENVAIRQMVISSPAGSPNTDGIHVEMSRGVMISNTSIQTGDDCISIGPGSTNVWVENVSCGPGHGISIGSLGRSQKEMGVKNITVNAARLTNTTNGLRIKTWPRASTSFVDEVSFRHAAMKNVTNPIIINQNYCLKRSKCGRKSSGVKISRVQFWNITGTSATEIAVKLDCSASNPCEGISLRDINLTYDGRPAKSFCRYAAVTTMGVVDPPACL